MTTSDMAARRRFTKQEIWSFQLAVAHGERPSTVARKHRFAVSNFRRWATKYGEPHVDYVPNETDVERARSWRNEPTLERAWRTFVAFADAGAWAGDAQTPVYSGNDRKLDEYEHLELFLRPEARLVLFCEKKAIQSVLERWNGPREPSVAHRCRLSIATTPPLLSRWSARLVVALAKSVRAPVAYFGDLDPLSIHAFGALRAGGRDALLRGARPKHDVRWIGGDDRWMVWDRRLRGLTEAAWNQNAFLIRLNWLDREYWELVKRLVPDARRIVGRRAFELLERGMKIELDAFLYHRDAFVAEVERRIERASRT